MFAPVETRLRRRRWIAVVSIGWLVSLLPPLLGWRARPLPPLDFATYQRASEALARGDSPYGSPEHALAVWRSLHADERALEAADADGRGRQELQAQHARPLRPGPYVYPPTLARLVGSLHVSATAGLAVAALSTVSFAGLWIAAAPASPLWLVAAFASWDVLATLWGGNVELPLLFVTLAAAWLTHRRKPLLAAPLVALALLVKPFYVCFFVAFAALASTSSAARRRELVALGVATGVVVACEVLAWPPALRVAAAAYLRDPIRYQFLVLPPIEQSPMSIWNRTPLQAFVVWGLPAATAQWVALVLWLALVAVTLALVRRRSLGFPVCFALALTLLYLGRPIGWGLLYFELVVGVAVWPSLVDARARLLLIGAIGALMASHWAAALRTAAGGGMAFVTQQRPRWPWETFVVLPAGWLLVLRAARLAPSSNCESEGK
ncbi:MAG: hypothetical protein JWM53_3908 [bacterium]|nr:hypothetical protein [bacterium]